MERDHQNTSETQFNTEFEWFFGSINTHITVKTRDAVQKPKQSNAGLDVHNPQRKEDVYSVCRRIRGTNITSAFVVDVSQMRTKWLQSLETMSQTTPISPKIYEVAESYNQALVLVEVKHRRTSSKRTSV